MTSKEKKDLVLRQAVKPELKKAGYSVVGQTYYRMQEDCCIAVNIQSSQFNSAVTGYSFRFNIEAFPQDVSKELLKSGAFGDDIHEAVLLPDCGHLHPYRTSGGYQIDGYRNYKPMNMDVEDIEARIGDDMGRYILPQLAEIKNLVDWETKKQEWKKRYDSKRVLLLSYFSLAQMLAETPDNHAPLLDARRRFGLSAAEIKENHELYLQVKAFSTWPDDDKWGFILSSLSNEA